MSKYGTSVERLYPDIVRALEPYDSITYDPEGIAAQRAGGEFLKQHPEYMPTDPSVKIYNHMIRVPGNDSLKLRIYEPVEKSGTYPGFIWLHGGGMTIGLPESDDGLGIRLVKEAGCIVFSVEYRLAPENPYPIPLQDCYEALCWVKEHAAEFSVDPLRLGIGGLSGGGGLATAAALKARDENGPSLRILVAITPMINRKVDGASAMKTYHPKTLNRDGALLLWGYYAGDQVSDIYMEPLLDDMHDLPPVYIAAGDLDPFRDDAIAMAQKCMAQDIPTDLHIHKNFCHGGETLAPASPYSAAVVTGYVSAIREALSAE